MVTANVCWVVVGVAVGGGDGSGGGDHAQTDRKNTLATPNAAKKGR